MKILPFEFNGINLAFGVDDGGKLLLLHCSRTPFKGKEKYYEDFQTAEFRAVEVQLSGGHINYAHGTKNLGTSEGATAKYVCHETVRHSHGDELKITLETDKVRIVLHYVFFDGLPVMKSFTEVTNISGKSVNLEYVSSFLLYGIGKQEGGGNAYKNTSLLISRNATYREYQWRTCSLESLGFVPSATYSATADTVTLSNTGSFSTKKALPKGVVTNAATGENMYWHIESNGSWSFELGDYQACLYIALSGPNQTESQWIHTLGNGETFTSVAAVTAYDFGDPTDIFAHITRYTRLVRRRHADNEKLNIIFNPYMHNAGEYPDEKQTEFDIDGTADLDIDCFCIDAGWHDDKQDYWKAIGEWKESKLRFPNGINPLFDKLRARGVKPGLWVEIEMMGYFNEHKNDLTADCYFMRGGGIVANLGRINMDFSNPKVTDRVNAIMDDIVKKYDIGYLKIDYNADTGAGTEVNAASLGDGLLRHNRAYLKWINSFMDRYPQITVEACASGGMRADPLMQTVHSIFSTSDQTDYLLYPYIASNMLTCGTPEQMAVWCYPKDDSTEESIIMNVVNTLLGRIHLSGRTAHVQGARRDLIKEGLKVHRDIADFKKQSVPFFPTGLNTFGADRAVAGIRAGDKAYLAVWNLTDGEKEICVPLDKIGKKVAVRGVYPHDFGGVEFGTENNVLKVRFNGKQARFFGLNI